MHSSVHKHYLYYAEHVQSFISYMHTLCNESLVSVRVFTHIAAIHVHIIMLLTVCVCVSTTRVYNLQFLYCIIVCSLHVYVVCIIVCSPGS